MRIAHVIMAHKGPEQMLRMIDRMSHPQFDFYIHVDAKTQLNGFDMLRNRTNVFFIRNRKKCNWGGWSFTKAIISTLAEIIDGGTDYGFFNLLSGQDYPLISPDQIYQYFEQRKGQNFIRYSAEDSAWWEEATARYGYYHFTDSNIPGKYLIQKLTNALLPKREFPDRMKLYGGSHASWWTISGQCAMHLVHKVSRNSRLDRFLKYCWGTDEFVITTIIMNSPFKEQTVNENFRYIDWSEGGGHPKILETGDFDKIVNSGMMFARKFDAEKDSVILDLLDSQIAK